MNLNIINNLIEDRYHVGVEITEAPDGYTLSWTDFVANEWSETFPTLAIALARLAVLAQAGETDWEYGFTVKETDFPVAARVFLNGALA